MDCRVAIGRLLLEDSLLLSAKEPQRAEWRVRGEMQAASSSKRRSISDGYTESDGQGKGVLDLVQSTRYILQTADQREKANMRTDLKTATRGGGIEGQRGMVRRTDQVDNWLPELNDPWVVSKTRELEAARTHAQAQAAG